MARRAKASEAVKDESVNPADDHAEPTVVEAPLHWPAKVESMVFLEPKPAAPPDEKPATVRVMLLCRDVFLPVDPTVADWASATTQEYKGETPEGRRTKLDVHPSLAEFLQKRKQAEILDD